MPEEDGRKMDEIRKYSAIYGRFDCKRKLEKPLSLHEVGFGNKSLLNINKTKKGFIMCHGCTHKQKKVNFKTPLF